MFIDEAEIFIRSGKGGDGRVAFRREKFVPKGGPAGGNGGKGGSVIFLADENLHTLLDFRYNRKYEAEDGAEGGLSLKDGKNGKDIIIKVPTGTLIKDKESGNVIADMDEHGKKFVAARGGKGGKGNSNFATSTNQAPRYAEPGREGKEFKVRLELKLLADVGLVGFPNAGKSTLISTVSAAKPKIADYPFTTLQPNLGIVKYHNFNTFTIADIPGIIEGAHEGKGLGLKFLKHIERTSILLIMVDISEENPDKSFETLMAELKNYSSILASREKLFVFTKADIIPPEEKVKKEKVIIAGKEEKIHIISSVSGEGITELLDLIWQKIKDRD